MPPAVQSSAPQAQRELLPTATGEGNQITRTGFQKTQNSPITPDDRMGDRVYSAGMETHYLAAVVQMNSGSDKSANLGHAVQQVQQASAAGATLVALPEMFNCMGSYSRVVEEAEPIPGATSKTLAQLAADEKIYLLAGSIYEQDEASGVAYNTSLLFSPTGEIIARYRKIHLFDVHLSGQIMADESRWIKSGNEITVVNTSHGCLGLSICYDLRFPELYRQLSAQGAEIIFVPAAFLEVTGRAHWEVLLRARAIENQVYVIAANQCGEHPSQIASHGHSMIVDAWGNVLVQADSKASGIFAEINLEELRTVREQLPALKHRQEFEFWHGKG